MNLDFGVVISSLVGLFLLIAVGFSAVRLRVLAPSASAPLSALLLKIAVPCTVFISLVQREYDPAFVKSSLTIIAIGFVWFLGILLISRVLSRLLRVPEGSRGAWGFCCAFSNTGFMGYPVTLSLFGPDGLALAAMLNVSFNLLVYSLGALEISRDGLAAADGKKAELPDLASVLVTPINAALVLSIIFYFCRIPVPDVLKAPITHLSNITTPLSMVIAGMALAKSQWKECITDRDAWTSALFRLLIWPVIILFVLRMLPIDDPLVISVAVVIFAMPAPGVTTMLAELYHGNLDFTAHVMFIHNIACIITIPLICMLL